MEVRCSWALSSELEKHYHDTEWGIPSYDDFYLFEMLILEGMQAGLSWKIILKRREMMRKAFDAFDYRIIAQYTDDKIEELRQNPSIIRHKMKLYALRTNARAFQQIQAEYGTFSSYLWAYVNNQPICNHYTNEEKRPTQSNLSNVISKDLKKRGFKFVGPTIIYAYLQAVGIINDHVDTCQYKYLSN